MPARVLLYTLLLATPLAARADDLIVLLQQRSCPNCRLADVDLVHADLRDADLQRAQLQRANLGQARLDGADLRESNLQFTNLRGPRFGAPICVAAGFTAPTCARPISVALN